MDGPIYVSTWAAQIGLSELAAKQKDAKRRWEDDLGGVGDRCIIKYIERKHKILKELI